MLLAACILIGSAIGFGTAFFIGATILSHYNRAGDDPNIYYKFSPIIKEARRDELGDNAQTRQSYVCRNQMMLRESKMYKNYQKHALGGDMLVPMDKYLPGSEPMNMDELGNVEDLTYDEFNDLDDFGRLKK
ncbi:MAG: hypothetical protein KBT07_01900 [Clostridiales bacterium]|nr:hypothetical protein [Candidatus Scatonaster coprocaballi]